MNKKLTPVFRDQRARPRGWYTGPSFILSIAETAFLFLDIYISAGPLFISARRPRVSHRSIHNTHSRSDAVLPADISSVFISSPLLFPPCCFVIIHRAERPQVEKGQYVRANDISSEATGDVMTMYSSRLGKEEESWKGERERDMLTSEARRIINPAWIRDRFALLATIVVAHNSSELTIERI
jgi:hypothetical protein